MDGADWWTEQSPGTLLVCARAQCSVLAYSMICRCGSHHHVHAVCLPIPSSTDSLPQPKTEQPFKKTSGAWKTGRLSGTWHSTRTSAADYYSPDLARMKITTVLHGHTLATVFSAKCLALWGHNPEQHRMGGAHQQRLRQRKQDAWLLVMGTAEKIVPRYTAVFIQVPRYVPRYTAG